MSATVQTEFFTRHNFSNIMKKKTKILQEET